jgi:hypothetical protein
MNDDRNRVRATACLLARPPPRNLPYGHARAPNDRLDRRHVEPVVTDWAEVLAEVE